MLKQFPDTYQVVDYPTTGNPPAGTVWLWRTAAGWVEKRSDGVVQQVSPITSGQSLDLGAIKSNSAGFWLGGTLSGGPSNGGSEGAGCWTYKGDAITGQMSIVVWSSPNLRTIEGSWVRSRTAGNWGVWSVAPKAGDFQTTTADRDVFNGESWNVANGHVVTLSYIGAGNIKLKPITTWANVPQPLGVGVPAKPASGSDVVEYQYNPAGPRWDVVTPAPDSLALLTARVKALEDEKIYNNDNFRIDAGATFKATVALPNVSNLVRFNANFELELADASDGKKADGIVLGVIAANGMTVVHGTGVRVGSGTLGLVGLPSVTPLYLGESGLATLSGTGTGKLIQSIGYWKGGLAYLNFEDPGIMVEA